MFSQTTSSADGTVVVWDVSEDEPKEVQAIKGIIPSVNDTEYEPTVNLFVFSY